MKWVCYVDHWRQLWQTNYGWHSFVQCLFCECQLTMKGIAGRQSQVSGKSVKDTSFLGKVVNRLWKLGIFYDPETKQQSSEWQTTLPSPWPKKKSWTVKLNSKSCQLHFLIVKALSVVNMCLEQHLWIPLTMLKCCQIYMTKWEENYQKYYVVDWYCTMNSQGYESVAFFGGKTNCTHVTSTVFDRLRTL